MCWTPEKRRRAEAQEQRRLERIARLDEGQKIKLAIVKCDCAGLSEDEYAFINTELAKYGLTGKTKKAQEKAWKSLAPKLYAILRNGQKRFGFVIPEHLEVVLKEDKAADTTARTEEEK
jgi:hypothetical protein